MQSSAVTSVGHRSLLKQCIQANVPTGGSTCRTERIAFVKKPDQIESKRTLTEAVLFNSPEPFFVLGVSDVHEEHQEGLEDVRVSRNAGPSLKLYQAESSSFI